MINFGDARYRSFTIKFYLSVDPSIPVMKGSRMDFFIDKKSTGVLPSPILRKEEGEHPVASSPVLLREAGLKDGRL
jgi:hypothetical protein